jgi:hypothetical protein
MSSDVTNLTMHGAIAREHNAPLSEKLEDGRVGIFPEGEGEVLGAPMGRYLQLRIPVGLPPNWWCISPQTALDFGPLKVGFAIPQKDAR